MRYYERLEAPEYAVLVTGAWGIGKTFQVKQALPFGSYDYVSLYGIQGVEQLHSEVLAVAHPAVHTSRKILLWLSTTLKALGGTYALFGGAPAVINAFLRRELKPDRILIFDDLERCSIPLSDLLGAINTYVENRKFRVVVITHDGELADRFREIREKTFGMVIGVEPQTKQAFSSFVARLRSGKVQNFVKTHSDLILQVFQQSGEKSLRILRHVVEDLARLHATLSDTHLENAEAMQFMVKLFSAFDIEIRAGRLGRDDLRNRARLSMLTKLNRGQETQDETPALVTLDEKYSGITLEDSFLSDEALVSMFIDGQYDGRLIRESLDRSHYFMTPQASPPWRVLMNLDSFDDVTVEAARERMAVQFDGREVSDPGEMLHIFGLRLMLSAEGISGQSLSEVTTACKLYIDDLLKSGRLPARELSWRWRDALLESYAGYGYWVPKGAEANFREISDHLNVAREQSLRDQFPAIGAQLLEYLSSDGQAVFNYIAPSSDVQPSYGAIPFLVAVDPHEFVETWLAAPPEEWRMIQYALRDRYEHGRLENELPAEQEWVIAVSNEMHKRAKLAGGLAGLRIRRTIPRALAGAARTAASRTT